jgi:hypothetical protein
MNKQWQTTLRYGEKLDTAMTFYGTDIAHLDENFWEWLHTESPPKFRAQVHPGLPSLIVRFLDGVTAKSLPEGWYCTPRTRWVEYSDTPLTFDDALKVFLPSVPHLKGPEYRPPPSTRDGNYPIHLAQSFCQETDLDLVRARVERGWQVYAVTQSPMEKVAYHFLAHTEHLAR